MADCKGYGIIKGNVWSHGLRRVTRILAYPIKTLCPYRSAIPDYLLYLLLLSFYCGDHLVVGCPFSMAGADLDSVFAFFFDRICGECQKLCSEHLFAVRRTNIVQK